MIIQKIRVIAWHKKIWPSLPFVHQSCLLILVYWFHIIVHQFLHQFLLHSIYCPVDLYINLYINPSPICIYCPLDLYINLYINSSPPFIYCPVDLFAYPCIGILLGYLGTWVLLTQSFTMVLWLCRYILCDVYIVICYIYVIIGRAWNFVNEKMCLNFRCEEMIMREYTIN